MKPKKITKRFDSLINLYLSIIKVYRIKVVIFILSFLFVNNLSAQISLEVQVLNAGGLSAAISGAGYGADTITNLKVTGNINYYDFTFMKNYMPVLSVLDIEAVSITALYSYPANEIPVSAFSAKTSLTSIILPSSITSIGPESFWGCTGLTGNLTIPDLVTSIGAYAFEGCSGLNGTLMLSNSLKAIESSTFQECGFTGSLTIPNSVTLIDDAAFYNCSGFTGDLTIPNSVTQVAGGAFYGCSGFDGNLVLSNSMNSVGAYTFYGCSGFTGDITIPSSFTSIGQYAFYNCSGFNGSLTIPNSVTSIDHYSFVGCTGLTGTLSIPNGITSIGPAYTNDSTLSYLNIPGTVTMIYSDAFKNCKGIVRVTVAAINPQSAARSAFEGVDKNTCELVVPAGSKAAYQGSMYVWSEFTIINELYFVSFNSLGGTTVNEIPTDYNTLIVAPSEPSKTGYTFSGWYKDEAFTDDWVFGSDLVTDNITLYAKWTINTYAVSFNTDGGSAIPDVFAEYNSTISVPDVTTKSGYTFAGWYKEPTYNTVWQFSVDKISNVTTLYAKWVLTVSFESNGGSTIFDVYTRYNTTIAAPTAPSKTGYTFSAWYKETEFINLWDFNNDTVISNITLYAKWIINSYSVSFNSNGGSTVNGMNTDYNTTLTKPADPSKTGYTFVEWYKEPNFTNVWIFDTDLVTSNTTLYAKWTINSYTVEFETEGGSLINSIPADYNTSIASPSEPVKAGYTFTGWYKESNCINVWNFTSDKVISDTTLFAKWTVNSYIISFNVDGGSNVGNINAEYKTTCNEPAPPVKTGYTFADWYKEQECTNIWDFIHDTITSDTTLYAKWTINSYTATFDVDGGSNVESITVTYNSTITEPASPIKTGHNFGGWYKETSFENIWVFDTSKIIDNTTIYARWYPKNYTVSFNTMGGTDNFTNSIQYNSLFVAPTPPVKTGYTFSEWYKDSLYTNIWDFAADRVISDTALYAKWNINSYTVNFEVDGGSFVSPVTTNYNTLISEPYAPLKTGYTFGGWFKEQELLNTWNFASDIVTSDSILYAKWTINTYAVTFNVDGGSPIEGALYNYNSLIDESNITTKTGHIFGGWFKEQTLFTEWNFQTDVVTQDMTLYAKWTTINYTVSFATNGGSDVQSITASYNTLISEPVSPTKAGLTFTGWYKEAECINPWVFTSDIVTKNVTLYAKWTVNNYTVIFYSDGGSPIENVSATYNTKIVEPTTPTKSDYIFIGWYKEPELINLWNFTSDMVTENITLYAKWNESIGISGNVHQAKNKLYPNPFNDHLQLEGTGITKISIYNALGNLVMQIGPTGNNIDVSKLKSGCYFVRISSGLSEDFVKIIKN